MHSASPLIVFTAVFPNLRWEKKLLLFRILCVVTLSIRHISSPDLASISSIKEEKVISIQDIHNYYNIHSIFTKRKNFSSTKFKSTFIIGNHQLLDA